MMFKRKTNYTCVYGAGGGQQKLGGGLCADSGLHVHIASDFSVRRKGWRGTLWRAGGSPPPPRC